MKISAMSKFLAKSSSSTGFSLSELLVAAALLLSLVALFGFAVVGQLSYSRNLSLRNRAGEAARFLSYLMEIEAGESRSLDSVATLPPDCEASSGDVYLKMTVPVPDSIAATSKIYYYEKDGDLWRCGPPFRNNGRLDHSQSVVSSRVIDGAALVDRSSSYLLTDLPNCVESVDVSSGGDVSGIHREYAYLIQQDVNGGQVDSADYLIKAKSFFVCDQSS